MPFDDSSPLQKFKTFAKTPTIDKNGFAVYYTYVCPYPAKYVPAIENTAKKIDVPFESIYIDSKEQAQNAPMAWTTYAVFYNGEYINNEILNEKRFLQLIEKLK